MFSWHRAVLCLLIGLGALEAHSQACTKVINPGPGVSLTAETENAAPGAVLCLNAGTYDPVDAGAYASGPPGQSKNHGILKNNIVIRGNDGTTPSQVVIRGALDTDYAVKFLQVNPYPQPNNTTLQGVTVQGSHGGIQIHDFLTAGARLSGITLRDVIVTTRVDGLGHGVFIRASDRIVLDNVTITSNQTAINLLDVNDSVVMNSTVTQTGAAGLSVIGGSKNVIVGNTIGSPKVGPTYSFPTGAVVFYNTKSNRFENNLVQGHQFDGVDFQALNAAGFGLPAPQATQTSTDNYAGKNHVISTGFADGLPGGSGMWSNCSSHNTWFYGNDVEGSVECGICVWLSKSNMLQANKLHNHGITGIFASGGAETASDCYDPAYRQTPISNYFHSNNIFFNKNDQVTVRNASNHEFSRNYLAHTNGFGGAPQQCFDTNCQSAFTFETDISSEASGGHRMVANTSHGNKRGFWTHSNTKTNGLQLSLNRILNETLSRYVVPSLTTIDGGPTVGGNYWSEHTALGNPSTTTPFAGVIDNAGSPMVGNVIDRYPYQHEDLGRSSTVTVFEPRAGSLIAQGTQRTVRWNAPGCTMVDLALDGGTTLLANTGNTGYAVISMPGPTGPHTIVVRCKNSAGTLQGQGTSPGFTVTSPSLQLLAPGRDDVFDAGTPIWVALKKAPGIAGASVTIEFSANGGTSWSSLGTTTSTVARVTLPSIPSTAYGMIRVTSGTDKDQTDGVFAVRGTSGAGFTAVGTINPGQLTRLEWASPQGSRLVDITATVGATLPVMVANNLPDRGFFDWMVPDLGVGAPSLQLSFKTTDGTPIASDAAHLGNISTRMQVLTGNDVMIGGFVIGGSANKTVVVRARGPSLVPFGITNALMNPTLQLFSGPNPIATNDDWGSASNKATITSSGFAPSDSRESAILMSLPPGAYTAIVSGVGGTTGVGIVEVFEVDHPEVRLANISTRGQVRTGNDVMIGGFVVQGTGPQTVVVRARGPSLVPFGITNALADPMLQLVRSSDQSQIASNDNWASAPTAGAVKATGFAPSNPLESAIYITLNPGAYTAIVTGVGGGIGVGIIEVFTVQ